MKVSVSAYQRWSSSNSRASTSILPLYPKATLPSLGVIKTANLVQSTFSLLSQGLVCLRNSQPTETKPGLKRFEKHYLQQMPDPSKAAKRHLICPYVLAYLEKFWSSICWWPLLPWSWDRCSRGTRLMWSGKGRGRGRRGRREEKAVTWVIAVSCEYEQRCKRQRRNVLPGATSRRAPFGARWLNCITKFLSEHSSVNTLAA